MEKIKYDQLLSDSQVCKIDKTGCHFFRYVKDEIVIQFCFMHNGDLNDFTTKPKKRISLEIIPFNNLISEIPTIQIQDNAIILANSDVFDFALTYNLSIDPIQRAINIKLKDNPNIKDSFITQEETDGITITY